MTKSLREDDPLDDFRQREYSIDGIAKKVWVSGEGPAVIVMAEMPGIGPHVARFARWVRDAGFTVYLPSLFGRDGAVVSADEGAAVFRSVCISAEFRAMESGTTPVVRWLRGLARAAHAECGGPGVGAVGMCFTGNFAISMTLEEAVIAPVAAQPSMPLDDPAATGLAPSELRAVRDRLERDDLTVLAWRFAGDRFCAGARFAAFREALGDRFVARVPPDSERGDDAPPFFARHVPAPHSVFTVDLVDEAGHPTIAARDEVLDFLRTRLAPSAAAEARVGYS